MAFIPSGGLLLRWLQPSSLRDNLRDMSTKHTASQIGQTFVSGLPESLRQYAVMEPNIVLRIPAVAAEVGDLIVYDDADELTVAVGRINHRHFGESGEAVEYVEQILADQIRFRSEFSNGRLISCSSWNAEKLDGGRLLRSTDEFREFIWTGQLVHEHRTADVTEQP